MSGVLLALSSPHPPTSLQSLQGLLGLCLGLISEYQLPPSKAAPRALLAGGVALCWSSAPASRAAPLGRACSQLFLQFPASQDQGQPSGNTDTMRQRYPVPNFSGPGPAKREHGHHETALPSSQLLRIRASQAGTRDTTRQRHPGSSRSDWGAPPLQPNPSDPQCGP